MISRLILYALTIVKYRMIVPATRGAQLQRGHARLSIHDSPNACRTRAENGWRIPVQRADAACGGREATAEAEAERRCRERVQRAHRELGIGDHAVGGLEGGGDIVVDDAREVEVVRAAVCAREGEQRVQVGMKTTSSSHLTSRSSSRRLCA